MKTLKQIKEEYDNITLSQMPEAPEDLMLEGREAVSIKSNRTVPSFSQMPSMLLFRRIAYRLYPNKQVVALYYSKMVDKYLSIPFGPDGNLNLSESSIYNTLEELELEEGAKWEAIKSGAKQSALDAVKYGVIGGLAAPGPGLPIGAVVGGLRGAYKGAKRGYERGRAQEMDKKLEETEAWQRKEGQNPEGGLNRKGIASYRRKHPGSKLSMAVTTKPSKLKKGSKSANRRKSFCARMGGMKKRLTSAKTARDPDSRINKALRKWNCEESFKAKLQEKRQERLDEFAVPLITGLGRLAAGTAAGEMLYQGAKKIGRSILSKLKSKTPVPKKAPAKSGAAGAAAGGAAAGAGASLASKAIDTVFSGSGTAASGVAGDAITKSKTGLIHDRPTPKTFSGSKLAGDASDRTLDARYRASLSKDFERKPAQQNENKIVDIRNMIDEGTDNMSLQINGRTVTLNTSMAKRILEVYDSVNTKNKKIVESMLNEDLESFKKLLNFSIKV